MKLKPHEWTHMLGYSFRTTDQALAAKHGLELDGLTKEEMLDGFMPDGTQWMRTDEFKKRLVAQSQ